jgi:hypothetical protein
MVDYTIVPRNQSFWLVAVEKDGSRRTVARFKTEDEAVKRLRDLQEKAGVLKPKFGTLPPRYRY